MTTTLSREEAIETLAKYLNPYIKKKNQNIVLSGPAKTEYEYINQSWFNWLTTLFPSYVSYPGQETQFSEYQTEFWDWIWTFKKGISPGEFVGVWPRGGAKSTSAELACTMVAAKQVRSYGLYVCDVQDRADDHLQNIATMLESPEFSRFYPFASQRRLSKFGAVKGWRRNRLQTVSGFTIDAMGMDSAARGAKVDEFRPDIIIIDDIDELSDTPKEIHEKEENLTKKLLPAQSPDGATLIIQNLIREDGVVANIVNGVADYLYLAKISGPYKSINNFTYRPRATKGYEITGGTPTWKAFSIERAQREIDKSGITSFLTEFQHEVEAASKGLFKNITYKRCLLDEVPDLLRVVVWCDPAVTNTDHSDSHGIQCDGIDTDDNIYRLYSWEGKDSPTEVIKKALIIGREYKAQHVGIETDQGGDTWESTYREAVRLLLKEEYDNLTEESRQEFRELYPKSDDLFENYVYEHEDDYPNFVSEKAGMHVGNKVHRATLMLVGYETRNIIHVIGTHEVLEKAQRRFPDRKPFDLVDASVWSYMDLAGESNPVEHVTDREVEQHTSFNDKYTLPKGRNGINRGLIKRGHSRI